MSLRHFLSRSGFKRWSPGKGVKKGGPERVNVAANILGFTKKSFGRDVVGCAPNFVLLALGGARPRGQTEVSQLGHISPSKKNVARFDVPVNQPSFLKGELQGRSNAEANLQNLLFRKLTLFFHALFQRGFIEMLHDEVKAPLLLPQGENADDVGVGKGGGDLNFIEKLFGKRRVLTKIGTQDFQGDMPIEAAVFGQVDCAHPPLTQFALELVVTKGLPAGGGRQLHDAKVPERGAGGESVGLPLGHLVSSSGICQEAL